MQRTRTRIAANDNAPPSPAWSSTLKQLDFYYKTDADAGLLKRSKYGGMVTIVCAIVLVYLVISELVSYVSSDTVDVLTVDTRRGEKLPINMDIYFPGLTCMDVAVDVVEASSGESIEEADHQIIKQRVDVKGKPLAEGIQKELGSPEYKIGTGNCAPCMPNDPPRSLLRFSRQRIDKNACCPKCEDVRNYLKTNRLPQALADSTPQCKIEANVADDEGCRVHGFLEVPRGKGEFHVAAGSGFSQSHESHQHHMHQIDWSRIHRFNISHTINRLSFGPPIPKVENPLDRRRLTVSGLAQHIYMIQVVPTTYESGSTVLHTNQYSFTQHHQRIDGSLGALPGVYFKYEINPLMIHIHDKETSFANFLTRICAIVGGLYVVFGIVYKLSATVVETTTKKRH